MPPQNPILSALEVSLLVNRRDRVGQVPWTEWRTGVSVTGGTTAQAGFIPLLGPDGTLDPSFGGGSTVSINGASVTDPNFTDATPAAPMGFSNVRWQTDINGNVSAYYATSGTTVAFGQIESGDNASAAMTVSGTAVLEYTGSGVVNANEIGGIGVAINTPTHVGQLLISQPGNNSAAWADPQVQGLYPAGSSIASPPAYAPPTTITPVLIGAADPSGNLQNVNVNTSGQLLTSVTNLAPATSMFKTVQVTNAGLTALWTPASGKKFRITRVSFSATEDRLIGTLDGADVTISLSDGSADIGIAFDTYILPGDANPGLQDFWQTGFLDLGTGYLSVAANNVLNVNLSIALDFGAFRVNVIGDEE